jgi:hypothetical protein
MGKLILIDGDKVTELEITYDSGWNYRKDNDYRYIPNMIQQALSLDLSGLNWNITDPISDRHFIEIRYKDSIKYKQHFKRISFTEKGYPSNPDGLVTINLADVRIKVIELKAQYDNDVILAEAHYKQKEIDRNQEQNDLIKMNKQLETLLAGWEDLSGKTIYRDINEGSRTWRNGKGITVKTHYNGEIELSGRVDIETIKVIQWVFKQPNE